MENISPYKQAQEEGIPFVEKLKQMADDGDTEAQEALDKYAPTGQLDESSVFERNSELVRKFAWDVDNFKQDAQKQPMANMEMPPMMGMNPELMKGARRVKVSYDIIFGNEPQALQQKETNGQEDNGEE